MDLGVAVLGFARVPLARHRSADERARRLHVRRNAHVDAMGHRVLQPPARQFPGRLGCRPALRHSGQLRSDVVDLGRARCIGGRDSLVDSRAASAAPGDIGGAGMSIVGTQFREKQRTRAERLSPSTPYFVLWSTGVVAFVLGMVAFVLWGITGPGTLFDMIVALCT